MFADDGFSSPRKPSKTVTFNDGIIVGEADKAQYVSGIEEYPTDKVWHQLRKLDREVARSILDFMDQRIANLEDPWRLFPGFLVAAGAVPKKIEQANKKGNETQAV